MIGVVRRIFDGMMLDLNNYNIIYEVLCIFFVEGMVIVNLWLIIFVFMDLDLLFVLIFNILLI